MEQAIPGIVVGGGPSRVAGAYEVSSPRTGRVYHSKLRGDGFLEHPRQRWLINELREERALARGNQDTTQ